MSDAAITAGGRPGLVRTCAAGVAATVAGGLVLGTSQGAMGYRALELGYWALGLGLLVGVVVGRADAGVRSKTSLAIPLAFAGVILTQLTASAVYLRTGHPADAYEFWRTALLGKNDMTFYLVAAVEAYLVAVRVSELRAEPEQREESELRTHMSQ